MSGERIRINDRLSIDADEIDWQAIRAQGAGGQHVNKTSSAVELRFDIGASSLPEEIRARLLAQADRRINQDGVLVLKSQSARSQHRNKAQAVERLCEWIDAAASVAPPRVATRPKPGSVRRRLQDKRQRASTKRLRGKPAGDD